MKTKLLIEQHFHGAFGVNFNTASVDDVLFLSKEILKYGIGGIFPTLVTDSVENINRAVAVIKEAAARQSKDMAKILGIHLEGIFINEKKKGIHNPSHFMTPTVENYKLIEDDFIKIVTLAPELSKNISRPLRDTKGTAELCEACDPVCRVLRVEVLNEQSEFSTSGEGLSLIDYLRANGIKVQAGHCVGGDLTGCTGTTHTFNAMEGISHRGKSTALSALINDDLYSEVIADGVHVSDDALKLFFKCKPVDKVLLVSDCLPCTRYTLAPCGRGQGEGLYKFTFADSEIFYDGKRAASKDGTLAGSTTLLPDIIKRLYSVGMFNPQFIVNPYNYHNIDDIEGSIEWDDEWNIIKINR